MLHRRRLARAVAWAVLAGLALIPVRAWADFATGQAASLVLGTSGFWTVPGASRSQSTVTWPTQMAFDASGSLWVRDLSRILRFAPPFTDGMNASLVIGAPDFTNLYPPAPAQNNLDNIGGIAFDAAGNLWATDIGHNRVLRFSPPFTNGMNASLVLGQSDFVSESSGTAANKFFQPGDRGTPITFDSAGRLWIADTENNRVLRFSPPFTTGMSADLVLGQSVFTSSAALCHSFPNTASALQASQGLAFDGAGNLWVGTHFGGVRKFVPPFSSGMNASVALGVADFTVCTDNTASQSAASVFGAQGVSFDPAGNLWVESGVENRALRFRPPFTTGMNADLLLGQSVFTSSAIANGPRGMARPMSVLFSSGSVWVSQLGNSSVFNGPLAAARVVRFDNVPSSATSVAALALASSTVQLSWNATGDPFGASFSGSYLIQYSSDTAVAFSTTAAQITISTSNVAPLAAQSYAVGGLLANTTYFFRVWSANVGLNYSPISAGTTVATLAAAPALNPPAFLGVFLTSATAQWAALPASPSSATAEGYRLEASSTNFGAGTVYSSATVAVALSTLTVSSLAQNTTYFFRVGSFNWANAPNLTTLGSTVTLAAAPSGLTVGSVSSTSVSLSWSVNGNPNWTPYELSLSTDDFQTSVSTPAAFAANLTASATTLSLSVGTTYYFRVRARNWAGALTAFSATASTVTLPGLLTTISTSAPSTTALNWTWTNTAGPAVQSYSVYWASNTALLGTTGATSFGLTGLSTNTAYGVRIGAVDATGPGPLSAAVTGYTLAAPATGTAFTAVYVASVTLAWGANGNPGGTLFELHRSTDNLTFALISSQTAASYADLGIGNATFYYKIRARNGDGTPTAFDVTVSTFLSGFPPDPPNGLRGTPAGASIQLSWTHSPSAGLLQYNVYWDAGTGAVNYAATYSTVAASTNSFTTPLLAPGTYYFAVRAKNTFLLEEKNVNVRVSAVILAAAPFADWTQAQVQAPFSGRKVWGNRVTLSAAVIRGAASSARQVEFQYRAAASTTAPWISVTGASAANPVQRAPYYVHWDVTGLALGDYEVRAVASNGASLADPVPPTQLVTVASAGPEIEGQLVGGALQHREAVGNAAANAVFLGGLGGQRTTFRIALPAGALGAAVATVLRVVSPPVAVPAAPRELSATGVAHDLTLENGQTVLASPAVLTVSYTDDDNDGIVDGTLARVDRLAILYYNPGAGLWVKEGASTVDPQSKTVSVPTVHFSVFGLFAPAAASLDAVRVYPNPYVPNDGADDNGKPFSAGDTTSGVIFDNLTQSVQIEIFTVSGSLVWKTSKDNSSGKVQWDGRNLSGQAVATGGYIALIRDSSTKQQVVRKIAIVR